MPKRKTNGKKQEEEKEEGDEEEGKMVKVEKRKGPCITTPLTFSLTRTTTMPSLVTKSHHPLIHTLTECLQENDKYMVIVRYLRSQTPQIFSVTRSELAQAIPQFVTLCRFHRGHILVTIFQELTRLMIHHSDRLLVAVIRMMSALLTRSRDIPTIFTHCINEIWIPFVNMNNNQKSNFPFVLLSPHTNLSPFFIREILPIYKIEHAHMLVHLLLIMRQNCPLSQQWTVYFLLEQYIQQLQEYAQPDAAWMAMAYGWRLESTLDVDIVSLLLVPIVGWIRQEEYKQKIKRIQEEEEEKKQKEEKKDPPLPPFVITYPFELQIPWAWFYDVASGVDQDALKSKRWDVIILSGIRPSAVYCSNLSTIAKEEVELFTITWESRAFTVWRDYSKWLLASFPRELAYLILESRSSYSSQEILGTMYKHKR